MASGLRLLNFRCTECGHCCRDLRVPLTSADLARLVAASGEATEQLVAWLPPDAVDMTGEPGSFVLLEHGRALLTLAHRAAACRFLGVDQRCTVYEGRPASCRLFPFAPSFGPRGGLRRLRLLSGTECEKAHDGDNDPHALRIADEQRWAEHRAYLAQVDSWNRSQGHRARLGHKLRGAPEFLEFVGISAAEGTKKARGARSCDP